MWQYSCPGYYWLDKNHILLYPQAGQRRQALVTDASQAIGVAPQSAVINLDNGAVWLPPVNPERMSNICDQIYWSSELGILINAEFHNETSTVSTYTYGGRKLASYSGSLADISPSGTKILIGDNTLIDLGTGKKMTLAWSLEDYQEEMLSDLFWSSDETRIYRCCYFYADLAAGTSQRFERSDFQDTNGNHLDADGLWFYRGGWIQNSTHFLVIWSYIDDGDMRYIPMFDPNTKLFYDVREMAGIPEDLTCPETTVSNNDLYIWTECYDKTYLVSLATFETDVYAGFLNSEIHWSADDEFALLESYDSSNATKQYHLLSLSNKKLETLTINDLSDFWYGWWHPTEPVFAYISEDNQKLVLFNAETLSTQELPTSIAFQSYTWSPNGDRIALVGEDGSVWQVDYPALENLEQLTPSLPDVRDLNWSPDGNSISFISGSDIYIVDTK